MASALAPVWAVEVDDASKRFARRWALARLSFRTAAGRSVLLTGHNGSGKTTLLRMLASATRPTAGRVRVLGYDVSADPDQIRPRVGLLSHSNHLYEDLTALQNLRLFTRALQLGATAADDALASVGLKERAHAPVRTFSAGMRKRLALARLILKKPQLVLLDEPFGELDPAGMTQMETVIRGFITSGATVILATHYVEQGRALCDERLHLEAGRAVAP